MKRRDLDFRNAEQIIEDIQRLRAGGYSKLKNWNLTQVCQHLSATMKGGMEGFGFRAPWIFRVTFIKWVFSYCLKKRKLFSGAPTIEVLKPKPFEEDDNQVIDECIEVLRRAEAFDGSLEDYALLDNLSVDDWQNFMWIHASHHLSFLVPNG